MSSRPFAWRWFFSLAALEAGAAFAMLLSVPHESELSPARLGVLGILFVSCLAAAYLAVRPPARASALSDSRAAPAAFVCAVILGVALFLLRYLQPERLLPYFERLGPLLWYLLLLSGQLALFSLWIRNGFEWRAVVAERTAWRAAAIAFASLLSLFLFVVITRIGITPDSAYWGEPGAPILGWQLGLAVLAGFGLLLLGPQAISSYRADRLLAAGIWLFALCVWLSVPMDVMKNSFYAPMDPPANQPFPNSDAGYYDSMAESLRIGYPFQGVIPTRPLYITLLTALHVLAGERFDLILAGQTMLLALIPPILFFLGRRLHSRVAGLVIALTAIFRELNSILISSQTRVSNSRTLLVDLPTLLLLLIACLFVVRWLQSRRRSDALVGGGLMGMLLLLRTQSLLLPLFIIGLAIVAYGLRRPEWRRPVLLFVAGLIAAAAPWLLHNYLASGQLALDAPFQYQVIASQYKYTGNLDLGASNLEGKSIFGILLAFALKDPKFVAGFIGTHFLATLIDSLLVLPLLAPFNGLLAPLNLYWIDWGAYMTPLNIALLVTYLGIISLGIGAAWTKLRWAGLAPLVFAIGYALTNGIGRFSGWRYDLPADWVGYFYFGIGIAALIGVVARAFSIRADVSEAGEHSQAEDRLGLGRGAAIMACFALVGGLPWVASIIAPPRYADQTLAVLLDRLVSSRAVQQMDVDSLQIQQFASDPQATLQIGRVLYPRYFTRGGGLASAHPWPSYAPRDFPRIGFLLLNQSRHESLMPMRQPPEVFPHGQDAIVLGCLRSDYIEVRLILFPDSDTAYLAQLLAGGCK